MFTVTQEQKETLLRHGEKVSKKLVDLTHQAHHHKVTLHSKHERPLIKFPLLLGILITLLLPVLSGIVLLTLLVNEGNLTVEKEER
jgi:hypothetical protein